MSLKFAISAIVLANLVLGQTVTITRDIPTSDHQCIKRCLYRPYNRRIDVGDVLECAAPYEEDCYCPSEDAQAELVSRHINACATESCSRGDLTQDIDKMRAHYATYCIQKGYTADLVEEWYSALETVASMTSEEETTTTTTSAEETETEGSAASTSGPTSTAASTTTEDDPAATTGSDDGRNPDGLPDLDDGTSMMGPGLLLLCLAPFVAFGQLF